ncbi:MAG: PUR family DNA/RNA-binding protein [Termitinemataceae bacterium]|nr:MAG: PUR family DNA/RNA-binding protein [Termitinemataceae bacterium]
MGVRGEVFSTSVQLKNRTYFFNVKENRTGDLYLNIVESKNAEGGGFERQSVILFASDLQEFLKGFDESLRVLEKSAKEKRRIPAAGKSDRRPPDDRSRPQRTDGQKPRANGRDKSAGANKTDGWKKHFSRDGDKPYAQRSAQSSRPHDGGDREGQKRLVVKRGRPKS